MNSLARKMTRSHRWIAVFLLLFGPVPLSMAEVQPTLALTPDGQYPASPTFTLLSRLATNVIVPSFTGVACNLTVLSGALQKFAAAPDTNSLRAAREAWKGANAAWRFTESFQLSLDGELSLASRMSSWPIRPASVQALLKGGKSIDDALLSDELGVSVLGLSTLEWLLFEDPRMAPLRATTERRAGGGRLPWQ